MVLLRDSLHVEDEHMSACSHTHKNFTEETAKESALDKGRTNSEDVLSATVLHITLTV